MSATAPHNPPRGPLVLLGVIAAFASFAVIAALLQIFFGGKPADPRSKVRLDNKEEVAKAQLDLLKKSGLADNADAVIAKAVEQIGLRKLEASKVVVPGSPTAIKQSAPAPTPAPDPDPATPPAVVPAPAAPAPASTPAPTPAPEAPIVSPPAPVVAPEPVTPDPAPVPITPPPVPTGSGTN
ncbi:MAG: hypothetical protein K8R87_08830 [Verrucomicrobia bacterium]|nr:hypothetical protein [Verrucomicrobiota bacterium]